MPGVGFPDPPCPPGIALSLRAPLGLNNIAPGIARGRVLGREPLVTRSHTRDLWPQDPGTMTTKNPGQTTPTTSGKGAAPLSVERRALVEKLLAERRLDLARIPILPQDEATDAPLAFTQERMWFLDRLAPGNPAFHITSSLLLSGELDLVRLGHCFDLVLERHAALRCSFHEVDGEPRQRIAPPATLPLPVVDLSALPPALGERSARRLGRFWSWTPFDLERAPLFRVVVFRLGHGLHTVQLTVHHLVADGWSMGILSREVGELYEALGAGRDSPLEPLAVQYPDFAYWQRRWLRGRILDDQLTAWREQLAGAPPVQTLPLDRPRPPVPSPGGAALAFEIPRTLRRRLESFARRASATPFMVLLAAWQVLLYRQSGQGDLVVGTAIANRNRPETEPLVGFFANTLALRSVVRGSEGFDTLLRAVRETALDAYDRQDLPFEKLVDALDPDRDLSRSPLFQTMVLLQNAGATGGPARAGQPARRKARLPGMEKKRRRLDSRARATSVETGVVQFDLTLVVEAVGQGYLGALQYRRQLFDATTIHRLLAGYRQLLAELVEQPQRPIDSAPWLDRAEHHQLVHEWSTTPSVETGETLSAIVLDGLRRDPQATAVITRDTTWTHGELLDRSRAVAAALHHAGVGLETPVAVCLDRTPWLVASLLGVLLAGGTSIPIDPAYPEARRRRMLEGSQARHVLSRRSVAEELGLDDLDGAVWVDELDARRAAEDRADLGPARPDSLAYVLFTSGSTGVPKGVAIPHRGPAALVRWALATYPPEVLAGVAATTSICFDLSVFELFAPLAAGGTVVLLGDALDLVAEGEGSPAHERLRLLNTVPSVLAELLRQGALPEGVEIVNLAGEALDRRLVGELARTSTVRRVFNLYGPSEDTTYSTGGLTPFTPEDRWPPSIGRPLDGGGTWIVDRTLRPVAIGGQGELVLGGAGLARGYLRQPARTAEVFVPAPWGAPGSRLYRTGDLARWGSDGRLHFLGRIDHQVKVRGFRIEPGEIEHALAALAPGTEVAVVASAGRLVAFLGGEVPAVQDLRAALGERLPAHLVPTAFERLDALPRLPNGKIDRSGLARRALAVEATGIDATPAANPLEAQVAEIFGEVLGRSEVGRRAGFFELGGHSLLAVRVIARLRSVFGVELPLRTVFEAPSVALLARRVEQARAESQGVPRPALVPAERPAEIPLTFAQERMWFLERLMPGTGTYNLPLAVRLSGPLDVSSLTRALAWVVGRHEGLRTRYHDSEGQPWQQVENQAVVALPVVDLSRLGEEPRARLSNRLLRQGSFQPFDLAHDLPWRAQVLRLADRRWIVLVVFHHIAADGASLAVFEREIGFAYRAFAAGETPQAPPLPVQMADVALWQRGWLRGEVLDHHIEAWRRRLAGAPPVLELPTDRPRPVVPSGRGASRPLSLEGVEALKTRATGVTPFLVAMTLVQALLARWSGTRDVVVGTPVAGRAEIEVEGLVGLFVNTLVLRVEVDPARSFGDLLDQVRERLLEAHEHRHLPFEKLVDELGVERTLSHGPVFQTMVVLEEGPGAGGDPRAGTALGSELESRPLAIEGGRAKFDLTFAFVHHGDRLGGALTYATDLFDATTVERWSRTLGRMLAAVVANPDRPLASLPWWSRAEHHQMVVEWGAPGEEVAPPALGEPSRLVGRCLDWARRDPEQPAVAWGTGPEVETTWTYGELAQRALAVAAGLRRYGVGPEQRVGLLLDRGPELIAAFFGTLAGGGAFVPLDPAYPVPRLVAMAADAGLRAVVVDGPREARWVEVVEALPTEVPRPLMLSIAELLREPPLAAPEPVLPDQLAYSIYTSGSTGRPKAVGTTHRALDHFVTMTGECPSLGPGDQALQLASPSFDATIWELTRSLAQGACLHTAPRAALLPGEPLEAILRGRRVDWIFITPSSLAILDPSAIATDSLRSLVVGGEASYPETYRPWLGSRETWNAYGPTEATVFVTAWRVESETLDRGRVLLGSRSMGEVGLRVADGAARSVPIGVAGELWITGPGLARGYLGRPERTAEVFVPDPWATTPGARAYRTGDLVRRRPEGQLEHLGRRDHQLKVRGLRIEAGEVESLLLSHAGVRQAVALVVGDRPEDHRLVAYVTAAPGSEVDAGALREALAEQLPGSLVPLVGLLPELPTSPNGKADRRALAALPPPQEGTPSGDAGLAPSRPPRSELEALVAGVWEEVLGIEAVGGDSDFFEAGGHSLLATRVANRLARSLEIEVPVRTIFEAPTVATLARWLDAERRRTGSVATTVPPLEPRSTTEEPPPLSFAQERMWFLEQLQPGTDQYNIPSALRIDGALDPGALAHALDALVARHEPLRTRYEVVDGGPVQRIDPPASVGLPVVDLRNLDPGRAMTLARELARGEAARPFDLVRRWPLRARLYRVEETVWTLVLTLHHIAADGASMALVLRQWTLGYEHYRRGRVGAPPLPALAVQYADYAAWQRSWLRDEVLDAEVDHWRQTLTRLPARIEFPTDRPRPTLRGIAGSNRRLAIVPKTAAALTALGREVGATRFMVVLAAVQTLLHRLSGQPRVAVGTPVAGRDRWQLEGLVGMFVNTLVLVGEPGEATSFRRLLEATRRRVLDAHDHQDVPFEKLVDALDVERSLDHTPLFQVLLTVGEATSGPGASEVVAAPDGGLRLRPLEAVSSPAKFDLSFHLDTGAGDRLAGVLTYATDLFDDTTAERWARGLGRLLDAVVADPDAPLESLDLWSVAERHQQVVEWNDRGTWRSAGTVPEQVVRRALASPEAVAVVAGDERLHYGDLATRSAHLARLLGARGVGPESRVAVRMERTPQLVVALLAALRAGAAYVPIDPGYPPARQRQMLEDSGAGWLIIGGSTDAFRSPLPPRRGERARVRGADWLDDWIAQRGSRAPQIVGLDHFDGAAEASATEPLPVPDPDSLAYILYTSGSTGRPKGVAIPHRGPAALVDWARTAFDATELAALVAPTSVCFDLSVFELFAPLAAGGTVQLVPDALQLPGDAAAPALVNTVPSVLEDRLRTTDLASTVATVSLAGEPLRAALVERIFERSRAHRVLNLYGPSEDTTYSTGWTLDRPAAASSITADPITAGSIAEPTIGRPILGKRSHVCDRRLWLQPLGVVGELCLSGIGLARGYLDRPAATAEVFVPDPFASQPGGRLYRTGDLARRRSDGELELLGRRDQQVKVRGFRIELEEIETRLLAHPAITLAAVVAQEAAGSAERRLVAWVVTSPDAAPSAAEIRAHLAAELPHYLVPSRIELVDSLPQTSSGKIDRRALASRPLRELAAAEEALDEPPRGVLEELLAVLWCEVLGVEQVSATADFFALGGHSLLATRLVARLERDLGIEVPVRQVFEAPTVRRLARAIETLRTSAEASRIPPLAVADPPEGDSEGDTVPLSFAQERLWFLEQLRPGTAAYNMPLALRLTGALDLSAVEAALVALVARHDSLRTRVARIDGEPRGTIDPWIGSGSGWRLPVVDLGRLDEATRPSHLRRLLRREARRPFRLAHQLPWRATVFRLGAQDHVLAWTLHHLVADGVSLEILRHDWGRLYEVAQRSQPGETAVSPLAPLPLRYADFARWQRSWLRDETLDAEIDFWRRRLAGVPEILELPTDRPRPPVPSSRGASRRITLSVPTSHALDALARSRGATRFMVLLAAYQVLLARLSNQGTVAVGSAIAGRGRWQLEGLVGLFVNTLVLAGDIFGGEATPGEGFDDLLVRTRERVLEAHEHQGVPFEKLVEALVGDRQLDHDPLFQVALTVDGQPLRSGESTVADVPTRQAASTQTAPALAVRPLAPSETAAKLDLVLSVEPLGDTLVFDWGYATDLFDATTIERWGRNLVLLLGALVEDPEKATRDLPWWSRAECHQLLVEWDTPPRRGAVTPEGFAPETEGWGTGLVERCLGWARRNPELPALAWGEGAEVTATWTYAELAFRLLAMAGRLRATGLPVEGRVGLLLDRGPDLVTAMLGTLAAGGGFVPLDPTYPVPRLVAMVEVAGLSAVWVEGRTLSTWQTVEETLDPSCPRPMVLQVDAPGDTEAALEAPVAVDPDQLAYVIFTSGSTGRPKGVGVPHRGLAQLVALHGECPDLGPSDRVLQLVSPSFDAVVLELVASLAHGACLHTVPRAALVPGAPLRELLVARSIDWALTPPAILSALASRELPPGRPRCLLVGGDTAPAELLATWAPGRRVLNAYGPTEASVYVSTWRADPATLEQGRVSIGRARGGAVLRVVDRWAQPVPTGVAGELWIGGLGLARGYLGQPARTAEVFVPDPWAAEPGARLYRSGDRVRRWADGALEHLGRLDAQLKVRGLRVEAGEVESAVLSMPGVRQAAAVVVGGRPEDRQLVVYAVADAPIPTGDLRAQLGRRLPESLLPSRVVWLDTLPTTPNGKVDRRVLVAHPLAEPLASGDEGARTTPRSDLEARVAEVWAEVLGATPPLPLDRSFFELGGHSLAAVRLVDRLAVVTSVHLPLAQLFNTPTVEGLAVEITRRLDHRPSGSRGEAPVALRPGGEGLDLWVVHGGGGTVFRYHELAQRWPGGAVWGFEARGLDPDESPRTSIAELADAYLAILRERQPTGPYALLGWSLGGLVVWEMARRLEAAGERVALLALVDTGWPGLDLGAVDLDDPGERLRQLARELGWFFPRRFLGRLLGPSGELPRGVEAWTAWVERARNLGVDLGGLEGRRLAGIHQVFDAHLEMMRGAPPEPLAEPASGPRIYFGARTTDRRHHRAWRDLGGETLHAEILDGDHDSVLRSPGVDSLVDRLVNRLVDLGGESLPELRNRWRGGGS